MKYIYTIVLLALFLISGCGREQQIGSGRRYVSLAPSCTEILFSLGLERQIIAVTDFCNYPPEARKKDSVGSFSNPSIEKIISLNPDIVFMAGVEQASVVNNLQKIGVELYVCQPTTMAELFGVIDDIGRLTGTETEAKELIRSMRSDVEEIQQRVGEVPADKRKKVFVEIWHTPLMTAGRGSFIDELISLAGGINIARDVNRPYVYFSPEKVIEMDPDCIILAHSDGFDAGILKTRIGWENISAVRNGNVYEDINPDLYQRPGPRLTQGLRQIYNKLYGGMRVQFE